MSNRHPSKTKSVPRVVIQAPSDFQSAWKRCVHTAPAIKDLCKALESSQPPTSCVGMLHEAAFKHHIHSVKSPHLQVRNLKRTTLQDIVDANAGKGLEIKEKYASPYCHYHKL